MAGYKNDFTGGFALNSIGLFGLYMNTAGIINPEGNSFEIIIRNDPENNVYKKIVLQENRLIGYILLEEIDRSGILTGLINDRVSIADFKEDLLKEIGLIHLPDALRHSKQNGGAA